MSEKKEAVNHPAHYNGDSDYECIKVLEAWLAPAQFIGFCRGNAIKYLCRVGKKDELSQELRKAAWYASRAADFIDSHQGEFS